MNFRSIAMSVIFDAQTRGADKSLARPGRKKDFDIHISYLPVPVAARSKT